MLLLLVTIVLSACASTDNRPILSVSPEITDNIRLDPLHLHSPAFIIENPEHDYNRIATPEVTQADDTIQLLMNTDRATVYAEERVWQGQYGKYTNLIYRIHFSEIPLQVWPIHLGAGKNIGLFIIITLNDTNMPVLITTLHTCGCYLSFTPTSYLSPVHFPENWPEGEQYIYGEYLPTLLKYQEEHPIERLTLLIRDSTHRVKDISLSSNSLTPPQNDSYTIAPLTELKELSADTGETLSFFETSGSRKEYVIDSQKILERLFISWWAFDWRVGEDKRLGRDANDGIIFYTSLKPWAREESDLRDFSSFLSYWGWKL